MFDQKLNKAVVSFRTETAEHKYFSKCTDEKIRQLFESCYALQPMNLLTVNGLQTHMTKEFGEGIGRDFYGPFLKFFKQYILEEQLDDAMTAQMRDFQGLDEVTSEMMTGLISDFSAALGKTVLSATERMREVTVGNIEMQQRQLMHERMTHDSALKAITEKHAQESEDSLAEKYALEKEKLALDALVSEQDKKIADQQKQIADLRERLTKAEAGQAVIDDLVARLRATEEVKSASKTPPQKRKAATTR